MSGPVVSGVSVVAISGSSGLVGSALATHLGASGFTVRRFVRSASRRPRRPGDIAWDPATGAIDAAALEGVDAVVHLAGASIAQRWTVARKRAIRDSRVTGTRLLADALTAMRRPPAVFVSASAVGYYGDGGDRLLDESSPAGRDFLAGVVVEWEHAARTTASRGIRTAHPRFGAILSADGGMLRRLLPIFRLGLGGKLGSGWQWLSWIALEDALAALTVLIGNDQLHGPVNVVSPTPVTNGEFTRTLGGLLRRPSFAKAPAFALRLVFGEMADAVLLAGQRVRPAVLESAGFQFRHSSLESALRAELARARP